MEFVPTDKGIVYPMKISAKIGALEITRDTVRILVVKTGGKRPKVLDAQVQPIVRTDDQDEREAQVESIKKAMGKLKHRPSLFTLCASSNSSIVRTIQISFKGNRKVAAAVPFELEPHLAIPIEELAIGHLTIGESDAGTDVLAVGLRRETLDEHIALAGDAGISIEGVGLDAVGLTALWQDSFGKKSGTQAVLHIRPEEAILVIVHNGRLSYLQRVVSGATEFQTNPRSAAREVQNIIRSYTARSSESDVVTELVVTGSRLLEAGRTLFENELDISVQYQDLSELLVGLPEGILLDPVTDGEAKSDDANRWSALAGTAMTASGGPMSIHFQVPGSKSGMGASSVLSSHALITATLLVVCAVTYFGSSYLRYQHNLREADRIGQTIWDEYAATFPAAAQGKTRPANDTAGVKSYNAMSDSISAYTQTQASFSPELFVLPTPLDILREIGTHMPNSQVSIQDIRILKPRKLRGDTETRLEITISGVVNQSSEYQNMLSDLASSSILELVPEEEVRTNQSGRETFEITLRTKSNS